MCLNKCKISSKSAQSSTVTNFDYHQDSKPTNDVFAMKQIELITRLQRYNELMQRETNDNICSLKRVTQSVSFFFVLSTNKKCGSIGQQQEYVR